MDTRHTGAVLAMATTLGLNSAEHANHAVANTAVPARALAKVLRAQPEPTASGSGLEPTDMRVSLSSIDVTVKPSS